MHRPLFIPGKDPVSIVQEAGWAPGPVWTGSKNLAPTRLRSSDSTARSQSLYPLHYPTHTTIRSSDSTARSQSLYRLRYPAHTTIRFSDSTARSQSLYRLRYPAHTPWWYGQHIAPSQKYPSARVPAVSTAGHNMQQLLLSLLSALHTIAAEAYTGKMMLKWILEKSVAKDWIEFIHLRMRGSGEIW